MCDPEGVCNRFGGCRGARGGGGVDPWLTQTLGVSGLGGQLGVAGLPTGGGGAVGTSTYIPSPPPPCPGTSNV